jgi:protein TonB
MATVPDFRLPSEQRRLYVAAAVALFAELAVFGGAWVMLNRTPATPPTPPAPPVTITLEAAVQPAPPVAAPAPQPQPQAQPKPAPAHPPAAVHRVARATPPPRAATPPPTPAAPTPSAAPTEAPPPAPPPAAPATPATPAAPATHAAPAAPTGPTPSFEGALRASIEAALHYPEAARMAGMAGRTRVAFHYRDGVVSDVTVLISSGMGMLDRAALAAVRDANCPKPEPAFAGKTLSEQLWVNFNLNDHE